MIWTIFATISAAVVAVLPGLAVGWLCARAVKGREPGSLDKSVLVFALVFAPVFAAVYVASLYALVVWEV